MPLKKSELYASLWQSCDELRGGMDASQYKDYVLVLLFVKYVSDKFAGKPFAEIVVPKGSSFADLAALKGKPDIGDQINKKIIGPLARENELSDMPDFNDAGKLGSGKEMVERLTNLIAIFERPALDFSSNRADGDDILGDAYEYLMRHFATESGKSKGQFYTPAEVSRIMAQILGISTAKTSAATTVYDPTCGSGSLLLKVGDMAGTAVSLYGQEKDSATAGLARMNMILHNHPTAEIERGNTLADPKFRENGQLKTFDYVVANPPFSDKRWSTGLDPEHDDWERFRSFGVPPAKQGDYAYLLHIIRSLKPKGKGACILPHGVLFRGNAEAEIRRNLLRKGYLAGIIGLPPNLFYGTGIPACILLLDKENAAARKGVFMIDASEGFAKDGPKNRLRSRDIHQIVDTFLQTREVPGYSRLVPLEEIEKNDHNLNLPRYIDSRKCEDVQDLAAHLHGGIPLADVDGLSAYWTVCPGLRDALFAPLREGYAALKVAPDQLREAIPAHPEFFRLSEDLRTLFSEFRNHAAPGLKALDAGCQPKDVIRDLSESLLAHYRDRPLLDPYAVYQHIMDYWDETLQDDLYQISAEGWKAEPRRILETTKNGRSKDKGWLCDLVPKPLIVRRYFPDRQQALQDLESELERLNAELAELEEEEGGEEGAFAELDKINAAQVKARLKELADPADQTDPTDQSDRAERADRTEGEALRRWLELNGQQSQAKSALKAAEAELDELAWKQYPKLSRDEIQTLVVEDKWMDSLEAALQSETDRIGQTLTRRVRELAERYADPLPVLTQQAVDFESRVMAHLAKMGVASFSAPPANQPAPSTPADPSDQTDPTDPADPSVGPRSPAL